MEAKITLDKFVPRDDIIGKTFGKLTVIELSHINNHRMAYYVCQCICRERLTCAGSTLTTRGIPYQCKSCRNKHMSKKFSGKGGPGYKHGRSKTSTYRIWAGLFTRCYNKKSTVYGYYGGRGITVCDRWRIFENFLADMGERPPNLQLDRINNTGNYEPGNCRWVTAKENNPSNKGTLKDNMPGKQFGSWLVLKRVKHKPGHWYYLCRCGCGLEAIRAGGELRRGKTSKCIQCKHKEHIGWFERKKLNG